MNIDRNSIEIRMTIVSHCKKSIPICSIIICFVLIHGTEKDTDNNSIMEPISWWRYIDSDILY